MTGHGIWSYDAHVVMEDISSLKLMSMALLQTSGYITQQMEADIVIDVNKFLGAFYESEFTRIRSYKHLGLQIDRERFNGVLNKP